MSEAKDVLRCCGNRPTEAWSMQSSGWSPKARTISFAASIRWRLRQGTASTRKRTIAAFLHATRIGMFDIAWNVLCPGCGGVLDTNATLKTVQKDEYVCALCADAYTPTLDEMVEVTFTVSPRVRRIAAHNPDELPLHGIFPPDVLGLRRRRAGGGLRGDGRRFHARPCRARAGRKGGAVDPASGRVHHRLRAGDAFGAVHRRQGRADARAPEPVAGLRSRAHPQPDAGDAARAAAHGAGEPHRHARAADACASPATRCTTCCGRRRPFLTAKRLLSNQTFRDLYRTDTLDVGPAAEDHQPDLPVHRPAAARPSFTSGSATWSPSIWSGRISRCCTRSSRRRPAPSSRRSATP